MENKGKNKLLLIPHYLGSLKYFEKLIPHLEDKYDVYFMLFFPKGEYFHEMVKYCKDKKYNVHVIDIPRVPLFVKKIPLLYFAASIYYYKKEVDMLLKEESISKMISVNDNSLYMKYLFNKANKKGIETMVLQWALTYPWQRARVKTPRLWRRIAYRILKPIYIKFKNLIVFFIAGGGTDRSKGVLGSGPAKKFGVINKQAYDFFVANGISKEKMSIVGYLDFHLAEDTLRRLDSDVGIREKIADKYGINTEKKNIALYYSPTSKKDVTGLSEKEDYELEETIVKTIRKVCPENEYDILFKIHPSEEVGLYAGLSKYGVKIFDKDTKNDELIYFADLYIAHSTTTNFIPIMMGKEAVFINPLNLSAVDTTKKLFSIKQFAVETEDFEDLLMEYSGGTLEKQYDKSDEDIFTKDSLRKILEWAG